MSTFHPPRALLPSDSVAVHEIIQCSGSGDVLPHVFPQWSLAAVAEALANHGGLALADDLGLCAFILVQTLPGAREILHLATAPRARRKGAMAQLMTQLVASRKEGEELWLEVHETNFSARQMYEKFGFRETGRRPKYYADGGAAVLYNLR